MAPFTAIKSDLVKDFPAVLQSLNSKFRNQFYGFHSLSDAFDFSNAPSNYRLCLCEHTQFQPHLNPYFDIDKVVQKDENISFSIQPFLDILSNKISLIFGDDIQPFFFVREASGDYKKRGQKNLYKFSFHIILRLVIIIEDQYYSLSLSDKYEERLFFDFLDLPQPPFDRKAYSAYNLRLLGQDKFDTDSGCLQNRIFQKTSFTTYFSPDDDFESFVSYFGETEPINIAAFLQLKFIFQKVRTLNYLKDYSFFDVVCTDSDTNLTLLLPLTERRCPHREHNSNNSSAMLHVNYKKVKSSKKAEDILEKKYQKGSNLLIKCLDEECGAYLNYQLDHTKLPFQYVVTNQPQVKFPSNSTEQSPSVAVGYPVEQRDLQDTIYKTGKDIYIKSGSVAKQCQNIGPNGFRMACQLAPLFNSEQQYEFFSENGVCKNNYNDYSYPIDTNVLNALKLLKQEYSWDELKQLNIHIGDVFNYVTTNNNYYGSQNENDTQITVDPKEQSGILSFIESDQEKKYVGLLLRKRMQYITQLYNVLKPNDFIYISDQKKDKNIFYFTNIINNKKTNGGFWTNEDGIRELRKRVRDEIESYFDNLAQRIQQHDEKSKLPGYIEKFTGFITNTIKQQGQMEQYAMETFKNNSIKFNQNRHQLHFTNGTYDLEDKEFIHTTPDMMNTQMINYEYDPRQSYDFIQSVIQQIIGNDSVYPWFIKQLSYCLHPDFVLEQKQIVILTGQGNNGKTLLMNLVLNTFDEQAYGVTGRPLMIQASTEQLSAATPDLVTLIDKRFCYFPELESSKQLNQTQIKQLTGGDRIKGRGLYADLESFEPYAGLFVSCNQLPDINTQDSGFLNRIKIIELKKQFVDVPEHQFHLPIDKKLLSKVKNKKWKQGFMNLLIYHFQNEQQLNIPQDVSYQIQSKINQNLDPFDVWADDNLQYQENSFIIPEQIRQLYNDSSQTYTIKSSKGILKKLDQFFKTNIRDFPNTIQKRESLPSHLSQEFGQRPNLIYNVRLKLPLED